MPRALRIAPPVPIAQTASSDRVPLRAPMNDRSVPAGRMATSAPAAPLAPPSDQPGPVAKTVPQGRDPPPQPAIAPPVPARLREMIDPAVPSARPTDRPAPGGRMARRGRGRHQVPVIGPPAPVAVMPKHGLELTRTPMIAQTDLAARRAMSDRTAPLAPPNA